MKKNRDLGNRLRRSTWRPVSDEARRLHQAAIDEAIRNGVAAEPQPWRRRRLVAVAIVATLGLLPAGVAVAAESSVPGDLLFPIKKATEAIRGLVDSDIAAEHRVEELERLVIREASSEEIATQVDRAQVEVDRLDESHELRPRLSDVLAVVADPSRGDRVQDDVVAGERDVAGATTTITTTTVASVPTPTDRPTDSVTDVSIPPSPPTTTEPTESTVLTTDSTVQTVVTDRQFPVRGLVRAGPTCPVQKSPPDPDCEDVPVAGAVLVFRNEKGEEIIRIRSGQEGEIRLRLPAGAYVVEPQPVDGLLGTAPPQEFLLGRDGIELDIAYDTGIR